MERGFQMARGENPRENLQSTILIKDREELLEDRVRNTLHLHRHAYCLGTNMHGEDLSSVDPCRSAPGWLVEEYESERERGDANANTIRFSAIDSWSSEADDGDEQHAGSHTGSTDNEQELSSEAIDCPGGVESEEDAEGSVECVDQIDCIDVLKDFGVDGGRVAVQGSLTAELLSDVDHEREYESLSDTGVLEESQVSLPRAGCSRFFESMSLANAQDFSLNLLGRRANALKHFPGDKRRMHCVPMW